MLAQPISRQSYFRTHAVVTMVGLFLLVALAWLGMAIGIWTTSVDETSFPVWRVPFVHYEIPLTFLDPTVETISMSSEVNPIQFFPGVVNLLCLGLFLCGFSAWCSSWDRYRWRTLGILGGFYMASGMLKLLGIASPSFAWTANLSFFVFYEPTFAIALSESMTGAEWYFGRYEDGVLNGLGPSANGLCLVGLGVFFYWMGDRHFSRRDLPAPL
jgi:ABC-2 type transport system permease protein